MRSRPALLLALVLQALPAAARDPCPLPKAARTILGILPHQTRFADVQARLARVVPHQQPESLMRSLCYVLERGDDREYLLVVSDGFAGPGKVSMVRLSAEPPTGPMVGECHLAAAPRGARSPIRRRVADVTGGLPEPGEIRGDEVHYSRRWTRTERTPWDEVFALDGYCRVWIRSDDGRVAAIESAWHEST